MHRNSTTVRLSQPCQENWVAMKPTAIGRHCAACQKVVVDFSQKTDAEILAYLARTTDTPCGRFRASQLGRPLQPADTSSQWRSWLGAVLALGGLLSGGRAAAQSSSLFSAGPTPTVVNPTSPAPAPTSALVLPDTDNLATTDGLWTVRGLVTDSTTGEGLPGVTVLVKGTSPGTSTDATGAFVLSLATDGTQPVRLQFNYVGYIREEQVLFTQPSLPLLIKLQEDVMGLAEIIVVGGYVRTKRPYPWHPRTFYYWSKNQLMRPFRHY